MKKPSSWKDGVTKARVAEKFVVKRTKSALKSMGVLMVAAFGLLAFANAEPRPSGPYAFVKPDPQVLSPLNNFAFASRRSSAGADSNEELRTSRLAESAGADSDMFATAETRMGPSSAVGDRRSAYEIRRQRLQNGGNTNKRLVHQIKRKVQKSQQEHNPHMMPSGPQHVAENMTSSSSPYDYPLMSVIPGAESMRERYLDDQPMGSEPETMDSEASAYDLYYYDDDYYYDEDYQSPTALIKEAPKRLKENLTPDTPKTSLPSPSPPQQSQRPKKRKSNKKNKKEKTRTASPRNYQARQGQVTDRAAYDDDYYYDDYEGGGAAAKDGHSGGGSGYGGGGGGYSSGGYGGDSGGINPLALIVAPLAGLAILSAAAAVALNPILVQLQVNGNGRRKKRDLYAMGDDLMATDSMNVISRMMMDDPEMKEKIEELTVLEKFLGRVPVNETYQHKLLPMYLNCNGYTDPQNLCLDRVVCEYGAPESVLDKEERDVISIILYHIMSNSQIDDQYKSRLRIAAQRGRDQHLAKEISCWRTYPCQDLDSHLATRWSKK